jgi:2-methylcitrate dehydratase PrpD
MEARAIAKTGIADCIGVMVAGAREAAVSLLDREVSSADRDALASLIPSGGRRNAEDAALVNGLAAHVLDYDDVTLDGHPSAVLVPAIFAQGEVCGSTGEEVLTAYAAGYEVWAELLQREPVPLHDKGWHPTAVRGPVAAAAACAKLRRLGPDETATALAIAASMAAGLVANFGSLTKSFQVGRAAQSGLLAAQLAEAGLTASGDALEHDSGFLAAFSPGGDADLDRPLDTPKTEWHLAEQGLNLKRYPACYAAHRSIDAILDVVEEYDLQAADIDRINVSTGHMQMLMLRNASPQTALEAKFSLQFAMASAVVARKVGLGQLVDEFVRDPTVQSLFPRVSWTTTDETLDGSAFAPSESVDVVTKDGRNLSSEVITHAKGNMRRPLTEEALFEKFSDCLGEDYGLDRKKGLFGSLLSIENSGDIREIIQSICTDSAL